MKNIIIAGGSGLVGKVLAKMLAGENYNIIILSRTHRSSTDPNIKFVKWNTEKSILPIEQLKTAHAVINLAGTNISEKRWSPDFKNKILDSRIAATEQLVDFYNDNPDLPLKLFLQASAVGYYGNSIKIRTETDGPGNDFMADVCGRWESKAFQLEEMANRRRVILRFGIVLSNEGGALTELAKPIKYGFGAALGSGKQIISWIHIYDLCKMLQFFIENNKIEGIYNVVAPNPVSNKILTKAIAKTLRRPLLLPNVPGFALKIILGEMAEALLASNNVSAEKISNAGFTFKFPEINEAVKDLIRR